MIIGDPKGVAYLDKKKLSEKQITDLINQISNHFHHPRPQIIFRYNHTKKYGTAYIDTNKISINYPKGFTVGTVIHEMAHIIESNDNHGNDFKATYYKILLII